MSKCDTCVKKSHCRLIEALPDNAVIKFNGCWQYDEATNDKKKLFLSRYLVDKAGGIDRIERLFDYQCEVVIVPDTYEVVAQKSD